MNYIRFTLVVLSLSLTGNIAGQDIPPNKLYAQGTFSTMPDAPAIDEAASFLKQVGYQGIEAWEDFYQTLEAANLAGISFIVNYLPLYISTHKDFTEWKAETLKMIRSSGKGGIICFHIPEISSTGNKRETDKKIVESLSDIAEYAADYEVKICTYPHAGNYCETVSQSVKFAKAVDKPNCGAMITLCHMLKVEGTENINRTIRRSLDYLVAVTISGADAGNTREMSWDRLIQPLGKGSFDTYHFLEQLWDGGYDGPVGIQFYGITEDALSVIRSSANEWQNYRRRYVASNDQ